jgi:hypothetical protein
LKPHEHSFKRWTSFSHAPTGPPPEHTSFMVLLCLECFAYVLFPRQNYELCTDEFKARFRERATAEGWHEAAALDGAECFTGNVSEIAGDF